MSAVTTTRTLDALPAVRQARAVALLQVIDKTDSDVIDFEVLKHWMIKQYRTDTGWTPAQLEQAVNDLADAGEVAVAPGSYRGTLQVERAGRIPS